MQKVVFKHLGLEDAVENVLDRMGNVNQIILMVIMLKVMILDIEV